MAGLAARKAKSEYLLYRMKMTKVKKIRSSRMGKGGRLGLGEFESLAT
jgi:hypothetical protein